MSEIRKETETINTLVDTYIKKGNIKGAIDAAKLCGRELTTEEKDSLVAVCIKKGNRDKALDVAKLGVSRMAVDDLVHAFIGADNLHGAFEAVILGASSRAIDDLLHISMEKEGYGFTQTWGLHVSRLGASRKTIDDLVYYHITAMVDHSFNLTAERIADALEAAKLGASSRAIDDLVHFLVKKGFISEAKEAAELMGKKLTPENILNIQKKNKNVGEGCFIATAAYGTPCTAELQILRVFRNEHLLKNTFGRLFVNVYYQVSPAIASLIEKHEIAKLLTRTVLIEPVLWIIKNFGVFRR